MLYRYYYQSSQPAASTSFEDAVLATSPTAYWRLGEASGGTAYDSSGNGHHMTAVPDAYGVSGFTGDGDTAYSFAAGGYCTIADDDAWDFGTGDFSLQWAMKHASGWPSTAEMFIAHDGGGYAGEWFVTMWENNPDYLRLRIYGTYYSLSTSADLLDSGSWALCHLTADRDGNAILYVNGESESSVSISGSSAVDLTNARALYLARDVLGSYQYVGSLDEVAIWKGTILTPEQVQGIYDARNG